MLETKKLPRAVRSGLGPALSLSGHVLVMGIDM